VASGSCQRRLKTSRSNRRDARRDMHTQRVDMDELKTSLLYWVINPSQKYDMSRGPTDFWVGNVEDDISLTEWIDYSIEHVATYALSEVAEILHALA
jgi:hypothetical protein